MHCADLSVLQGVRRGKHPVNTLQIWAFGERPNRQMFGRTISQPKWTAGKKKKKESRHYRMQNFTPLNQHWQFLLTMLLATNPLCCGQIWFRRGARSPLLPLSWPTKLHARIRVWYGFGDPRFFFFNRHFFFFLAASGEAHWQLIHQLFWTLQLASQHHFLTSLQSLAQSGCRMYCAARNALKGVRWGEHSANTLQIRVFGE